MFQGSRKLLATLAVVAIVFASCGGAVEETATEDTSTAEAAGDVVSAETDADAIIQLVSAEAGAEIQANPPEGLVILDVRTPEEFAEGHLEGAEMIDFYRADFADQIADLDPDAPYLVYCRSGNRSGQTVAIMEELGFTNVTDIDGGIVSWTQSGLETVTP